MVDFSNHRIFSLRCLSKDVIPVSNRLWSNIKTPKGDHIIRNAEKALLNERIRSINNTINMLEIQVDTCKKSPREYTGQREHRRMYMFHQEKEGVQTLEYLRVPEVNISEIVHKSSKVTTQTPNMVTMMKWKQTTPQIPKLTPITQEKMKKKKVTTTITCGYVCFSSCCINIRRLFSPKQNNF